MDQAQKVFRLERGDCCLAFCGDAQVAHPLFITVGSTLNNFIKTRSRAEDVTQVRYLIEQIPRKRRCQLGSWIGRKISRITRNVYLICGLVLDKSQI